MECFQRGLPHTGAHSISGVFYFAQGYLGSVLFGGAVPEHSPELDWNRLPSPPPSRS